MQTRSKTKQQQAQQCAPKNSGSQGIQRTQTIVRISVSDTGKGTHIRWDRSGNQNSQHQQSPETSTRTIDARFITPDPQAPTTPAAPKKHPHEPLVYAPGTISSNQPQSLAFLLAIPENDNEYENDQENEDYIRNLIYNFVKSKKLGGRTNLESESIIWEEMTSFSRDSKLDIFGPFLASQNQSSLHKTPSPTGPSSYHSALEPLGSPCYERESTPWPSTPRPSTFVRGSSGSPTPRMKLRMKGLGPSGTILIGEDGEPLVPELFSGYYNINSG